MKTRWVGGEGWQAIVILASVACGAAPPPPKAPEPVATAEPAPPPPPAPVVAAPAPESDAFPTSCAAGNAPGICAPPRAFVERLCGGFPSPDLALVMFSKDSPWTRAYINRNVEAWYTSGRQSVKAQLVLDEEVLVVRHPNEGGGIVVGAGSPFDVIRWDGVCASLGGEEVTLKRPAAPKRPTIPWQRLEPNVRDALLAGDPGIAKAEEKRRKECKGTTGLGYMSAACTRADDKLTGSIVEYVTRGGQTPMPKGGH